MYKTIITSGPSGIGKSHLAKTLIENYPDKFKHAKVYTTRPQRADDVGSIERVFVTDRAFRKMISDSGFLFYEKFAGYYYGYCHADLKPDSRHVLVDVSPMFLNLFTSQSSAMVIGLQAPAGYKEFLDKRMRCRGDSAQVRKARQPYIDRDIQDLATHKKHIDKCGKYFYITGNSTIPGTIMPWVAGKLGL